MARARRKSFNQVHAASLAWWIVVMAFVAMTGLCYVYLSLQLHRLGDRKKSLENELVALRVESDVALGQVAALTSRSALQRRLKEGYLKMTPIAEPNIVRLSIPPRAQDENGVQPVANKTTVR